MRNFEHLLFAAVIATAFFGGFGFYNMTEEKKFVDSLLQRATNYTPHTNMVNNSVYLYLDLYQLLSVDEKEGSQSCF